MKFGALLAAVAFAAPEPLVEVETEAYLGRWYQTHASFTVKYTFELGGNCVTADYGVAELNGEAVPNVITVTNEGRPGRGVPSFLRRFFKIEGFAAQSPDFQGALQVGFGQSDASEAEFRAPGNYWIFELGPMIGGKYQWALVTNASANQLYILVRDVADFRENYEAEVLRKVEAAGFTKWYNKPLTTNQDGCNYE